MNKIPNRQAICEVLMKHAETDKDIVVLCSDSRGSASLTPFANAYPEQFVEMGIAEQVLEEYEARDEFQDVAEYLVKDGSMCGYLFRCLHCEQFHLWVDAD